LPFVCAKPGIALACTTCEGEIRWRKVVFSSIKKFLIRVIYFFRTDIDRLIDQILLEEPLISEARKPQLKKLIEKLIEKQQENMEQRFGLFKVLRAHLLPLTNCAFNKSGSKFITGSYDRTCKVWDTNTGQELLSLDEHTNVVYTMAFNNPFG